MDRTLTHWLGALALASCSVSGWAQENGQPTLMSAEWAQGACNAWNADPVLTDQLVESGWVDNTGERGYKVLQIYRADCPESPRIELQIHKVNGKAKCSYGGWAQTPRLDPKKDYLMFAETTRWMEMGRGEYGPMRAMMLGRLQFTGPKMEAMGNMGPFANFLQLAGKVPSDQSCPR